MLSTLSIVLATVACLAVFVHGLGLPNLLIPHGTSMTEEYYSLSRPHVSLVGDVVLTLLYFAPIRAFVARVPNPALHPWIVVSTTAALTTFFCHQFLKRPLSDGTFFSRWFHTVGYASVSFDAVYMLLVFVVARAFHTMAFGGA